MNQDILNTFEKNSKYFKCPTCGGSLSLKGQSLVCESRHTFDIAKQGYVNLIMHKKQDKNYDKESFQNRKAVLDNGYYAHILKAVQEIVGSIAATKTERRELVEDKSSSIVDGCKNSSFLAGFEAFPSDRLSVLDVGCGEGYYSRNLAPKPYDILAFDISKDSVQIAAKADKAHIATWFVGDLSQLPIADNSIDCILNIYTPANYAEFSRVLSEGGYLVKVVPGAGHLKEFRELAKDKLRNKEFSNERVVDYFDERFKIIEQRKVSNTFEITAEDCRAFAEMTPLFFNVDTDALDLGSITHLTVEAEILIGKKE